MPNQSPRYIAVGFVEKPQGIKGEIKVRPLTDHPSRFSLLPSLYIEMPDQSIFELAIEDFSERNGSVYLRLQGINSREAAEKLRGAYLSITPDYLLPLQEDEFYYFQILGFKVKTLAGDTIGLVDSVMDVTSNAVLTVKSSDDEYLVPVIKDVVKKIDWPNKEILIEPIAGLFD